MTGLPILTLHSIDDSGSAISLSAAALRRLMEGLARQGSRGVTVSEALRRWRRGEQKGCVGLSFDDGYLGVHEHALPMLRDLGFAATVFAVAGRSGESNRWPGQASWAPELPLMGWSHLEELLEVGWEVGAHGLQHRPLAGRQAEDLRQELTASEALLWRNLGVRPRLLAYPGGAFDEVVSGVARERYGAALTDRLAIAGAADLEDPFAVPRVDAYYLRRWPPGLAVDGLLGRGYLAVRGAGRRLRRRMASGAA